LVYFLGGKTGFRGWGGELENVLREKNPLLNPEYLKGEEGMVSPEGGKVKVKLSITLEIISASLDWGIEIRVMWENKCHEVRKEKSL